MPLAQETVLNAIAKIEKLFSSPRVLSRLMFLLRRDESQLSEIVDLINCDASLAAQLIRYANSPFYGYAEKVIAIDDAVQKIGFRETVRLVGLAIAHATSFRTLASYGIEPEDFLAESLFNGVFMESISRETGECDPDEAYTVGLLRFIGRLAINEAIHDLGAGLFWDGSIPLEDWERENVGVTHSLAAVQLLRSWKFPDDICLAIEQPGNSSGAESSRPLVRWAHFAQRLLPPGLDRASIEMMAENFHPLSADLAFAESYGFPEKRLQELVTESCESFSGLYQDLHSGT